MSSAPRITRIQYRPRTSSNTVNSTFTGAKAAVMNSTISVPFHKHRPRFFHLRPEPPTMRTWAISRTNRQTSPSSPARERHKAARSRTSASVSSDIDPVKRKPERRSSDTVFIRIDAQRGKKIILSPILCAIPTSREDPQLLKTSGTRRQDPLAEYPFPFGSEAWEKTLAFAASGPYHGSRCYWGSRAHSKKTGSIVDAHSDVLIS